MAREWTVVDAVAEDYLEAAAQLDPVAATGWGVPGRETELPDYSPEWLEEVSSLRQATLRRLGETESVDSTDRVTAAALREELEVAEHLRASGADESCLNNISSPVQLIRDLFAVMPSSTVEDWTTIARRLAAVPDALAGYTSSLRLAAARGVVSAVRQVVAAAGQARSAGSSNGVFAGLAASAQTVAGEPVPPRLQADLGRAAAAASAAYVDLADFLEDELAAQAPVRDAVGIERYAVHSRSFLGSAIDLAETYEWGQHELARIVEQMTVTADRIYPGASVREAMRLLNNDPSRTLHGTDALRQWMQTTSDVAVTALAGTHFDIPESIQRLECRIASTHTGGIYYTRPSEDLTRPGRMWWSVAEEVSSFTTWSQLSTVYHEGVPGHHLQIAQTMLSDTLNRWRRIGSWISGHGEGWALYAENLMAELGYLNDPADYLGMLDSQSLRAARVVLDIGIHCEFPVPDAMGGGSWTYEKASAFLATHCARDDASLRYELDRYLGWPGQAPSYKLGERLWLQLRDQAREKAGTKFDLRDFHRRALSVGSVGLDVLGASVLGEYGD